MFQSSQFDYFEDDILSIMTQRAPNEDTLPLDKFWSQQEQQSLSQSALVSDAESDMESHSVGIPSINSDFEFEGFPDFELDNLLEDECFAVEHLQQSFQQTPQAFLQHYHDTVNESVEDFILEAHNYDELTKKCTSPLFDCLVQKACNLDDLKGGPKAEKTYTATQTAIRSFNFFWMNHLFDQQKEPELYAIRAKYGHMWDGFQALCSGSHVERNVMLAHYVTKMVKRVQVKEGDLNFVQGKTKRGYLNSLQRGMHMYEHQHQLTREYGDWSWTKSKFYELTKTMLKKVTCQQELAVSPSKLNKSSDYMTDAQFDAVHEKTWELSENMQIPLAKRLSHKQSYFMQGCGKFECLRARDDLANCLIKEFVILDDQFIEFQMKREFKSHTLGSDFSVHHKEALLIKGHRYVDILKNILFTERPSHLAKHLEERLFLKPKTKDISKDNCLWQAKVQGKSFCGSIISHYVNILKQEHHPLFSGDDKFTNSSIRKYHNHKLAAAGAPTHIQQASLAQNTRFYNAGPKSERMANKKKIAAVVSGERKVWHSPEHSLPQPMHSVFPAPAAGTGAPTFTVTELPSTNAAKKLRFSFQAPNANINFEYDV